VQEIVVAPRTDLGVADLLYSDSYE
jgi:hypothetical protein